MLLKFGGTYLDSDTISLKSLPEGGRSFIVEDGPPWIANGILRFSRGHPFLGVTLKQQADNFDPKIFGHQVKSNDQWCQNLLAKSLVRGLHYSLRPNLKRNRSAIES